MQLTLKQEGVEASGRAMGIKLRRWRINGESRITRTQRWFHGLERSTHALDMPYVKPGDEVIHNPDFDSSS